MVNRNVVIIVAVLVIVALGFFFVSTMTGNVITGSVANDEVIENEYFRIDEIDTSSGHENLRAGNSEEVDLNDTQNNSGSR